MATKKAAKKKAPTKAERTAAALNHRTKLSREDRLDVLFPQPPEDEEARRRQIHLSTRALAETIIDHVPNRTVELGHLVRLQRRLIAALTDNSNK